MVVQLPTKLKPSVADLAGERLRENGSHRFVHQRWKSFGDEELKAMRTRFGKAATSGRKTLKVPKDRISADTDLVATVSHREGKSFAVQCIDADIDLVILTDKSGHALPHSLTEPKDRDQPDKHLMPLFRPAPSRRRRLTVWSLLRQV